MSPNDDMTDIFYLTLFMNFIPSDSWWFSFTEITSGTCTEILVFENVSERRANPRDSKLEILKIMFQEKSKMSKIKKLR